MSARGLALLVLPLLAANAIAACGDGLGPFAMAASSRSYDVTFRTDPAPIPMSQHFALDIVVCPKGGAMPRAVAVDATMPAHGHGMNYRASVRETAPGRYRAEGLLFHMPGAWEFRFDLAGERGAERATVLREVP